jgi:hypothetical protein
MSDEAPKRLVVAVGGGMAEDTTKQENSAEQLARLYRAGTLPGQASSPYIASPRLVQEPQNVGPDSHGIG